MGESEAEKNYYIFIRQTAATDKSGSKTNANDR